MFAVLILVCILDFMEIVFVELTHKRCKIRVFEHSRKDGFGEFVHVLRIRWRCVKCRTKIKGGYGTYFDNETVALWPPGHNILKGGVFEHPVEKDKHGNGRRWRPNILVEFLYKIAC